VLAKGDSQVVAYRELLRAGRRPGFAGRRARRAARAFEERVATAATAVDRYRDTCAQFESISEYPLDGPDGVIVHAGFTRSLDLHRRELEQRFKFRRLLSVDMVRFSNGAIAQAYARVGRDMDDGTLETLGLRVAMVGPDYATDSLEVDLQNPSPRARQTLHARYGDVVRMNPKPVVVEF
jgi:hypothetical protein